MVTYITRAALEIVSQCGLGQSFDPLTVKEHKEHRYISSMKLLGYVMAPLLTPVMRFEAWRLSLQSSWQERGDDDIQTDRYASGIQV